MIRIAMAAIGYCCAALMLLPPLEAAAIPDRFQILPSLYRITLDVSGDAFEGTFRGEVTITLEALRETRRIVLESENLEIESIVITPTATPISIDGWQNVAVSRELWIELSRPLATAEKATLTISYEGRYDPPGGDGLAKHLDGNHAIWSTQLQPASTRKLLPVVGHPCCPSRFQLTVVTNANHAAFSNSPLEDLAEHGERRHHRFETTSVIAPYLLAFAAGDLEIVSSERDLSAAHARTIRVIGPTGTAAYVARLLPMTIELLDGFETWLDRPLTARKLDIALIPDFRYFGMENPGLLMLRAGLVEWAEQEDRWDAIRELLAHELAHQWFGNELAPARWRDIWISESFATWAQRKMTGGSFVVQTLSSTVSSIRGLTPPIVAIHPLIERHPESVFSNSRYARGAALIESLLARDTEQAITRHLVANSSERPLTTGELLSSLRQTGIHEYRLRSFETALRSPRPAHLDVDIDCAGDANVHLSWIRPSPAARVCIRAHFAGAPAESHCVENFAGRTSLTFGQCPDVVVPDPAELASLSWTLADAEEYARAFEHRDLLSQRERLSLLTSLVAGTWARRISAIDAVRFAALELTTSASDEGDDLRQFIMASLFTLSGTPGSPSDLRIAFRDAFDHESSGANTLDDMLVARPALKGPLLIDDRFPIRMSAAELKNTAERRGQMTAEEWDEFQGTLRNLPAASVRWLFMNPDALPWQGREAYDMLRALIRRPEIELWSTVDPSELDTFMRAVVPERYRDDVASAFARRCDDGGLRVVLGSEVLLDPRAVEQRDVALLAMSRCLDLKEK